MHHKIINIIIIFSGLFFCAVHNSIWLTPNCKPELLVEREFVRFSTTTTEFIQMFSSDAIINQIRDDHFNFNHSPSILRRWAGNRFLCVRCAHEKLIKTRTKKCLTFNFRPLTHAGEKESSHLTEQFKPETNETWKIIRDMHDELEDDSLAFLTTIRVAWRPLFHWWTMRL